TTPARPPTPARPRFNESNIRDTAIPAVWTWARATHKHRAAHRTAPARATPSDGVDDRGSAVQNECAATLAQARSGAGQTPRASTASAERARATVDAGLTRAQPSSPAGSSMYMATTTRR